MAYPVGPILPYVRQATLFHARRLLPVNSPVFPEALVRGRDAEQLRGLRELPRAEGGVCPLRCVAAARTQRKKASLSLLEPPPQCPVVKALKSWLWAHVHAGRMTRTHPGRVRAKEKQD